MNINFEEIYCKYYKSIYRYLVAIAKEVNIAEEITQETFFKALKNIDKNKQNIVDKIIDNEDNSEILKILHKLEEPYKEVFTLRMYGEQSFKQIGEIFDKSENWARVTYYRSKLKIKENLISCNNFINSNNSNPSNSMSVYIW